MKNSILIIIVLFTAFSSKVYACDCKGEKLVKEEFELSKSVISGRVISREEVIVTDTTIEKNTENIRNGRLIVKYTFLISEKYKGKFSSDTIAIYTGIGERDCGVQFEIGENYIVYGIDGIYKDRVFTDKESSLWTINCLRTRKYNKKEIEQIKIESEK
ncbi:hypothetical protein Fleli_2179 [Bernardetia litoralis DSM 6794]|uniref:Tissue inhibitor of metalloproteinase n=1 Tax=Bernardetia litoralis (strain ATCC 23117 / DSM 6794 / NBRC 15988 / NCIMB 1366 / Fx l1 / Sio-4) TaxID=880071 RepID=I4AKS3_BERLS|nr:hypothetical protein [Bernardetia litoralis]AFM04558.1 hypothetical protein Fleli_2179 [Bernardetia litoralis DSM 6794]